MSSSLYYLTIDPNGATTGYQLDSVSLNGTSVSGSPTVIEEGQPGSSYFNGLAIGAGTNTYFISAYNGTSAAQIYRETLGSTPVFGSGNQVANVSGDDIASMSIDSINNILYYSNGTSIFADRFGSSFNNTPTAVNIGTAPTTSGTQDYIRSLVYDQAESSLYVAAAAASTYIGFGYSTQSLLGNYIFKLSVSPTTGAGSASFTSAIAGGGGVPFSDGEVAAVALDTATDTLYFATYPYKTVSADNVAGVYALTAGGTIHTVWSETNPTGGLSNIDGMTIDPLTGDYYLTSSDSGTIYSGNISSSSAPTLMSVPLTTGEDTTTWLVGAAVIDPPSLSGIAVTKVNGTTGTTGTVTTGQTVTFTVTFSQAVNVTGTPTLTLNDGGSASYTSGSGGTTLVFTYTVGAGQNTSALAVTGVSTSGATIKSSAGNTASVSTSTVTFSGLVVETTAPGVTLTATSSEALQGGPAIAVLSGEVLSSVGGTLTSATISLGGYQSGDVLGINGATSGTLDSGRISYSASNGVLTLSGTDSLSAYDAAFAEITYQDEGRTAAAAPTEPQRDLACERRRAQHHRAQRTSITIDRAPSIVSGGAQASLVAGASVTGAALTGDTDPDGDSLTITALSGGRSAPPSPAPMATSPLAPMAAQLQRQQQRRHRRGRPRPSDRPFHLHRIGRQGRHSAGNAERQHRPRPRYRQRRRDCLDH